MKGGSKDAQKLYLDAGFVGILPHCDRKTEEWVGGASELMTLISTESLFVRIQLPVWLGAFWFKSDPYLADVAHYILVVSLPLVSYTLHAAAAVRG